MQIRITNEARNYILKKGKTLVVTFQKIGGG